MFRTADPVTGDRPFCPAAFLPPVDRMPPTPSVSPASVNAPVMEDHITVEGRITTVLPGTMFRVMLDNDHEVLAVVCGKMRKRWVRLTAGDRVRMEMSPYDLNKARITWRLG